VSEGEKARETAKEKEKKEREKKRERERESERERGKERKREREGQRETERERIRGYVLVGRSHERWYVLHYTSRTLFLMGTVALYRVCSPVCVTLQCMVCVTLYVTHTYVLHYTSHTHTCTRTSSDIIFSNTKPYPHHKHSLTTSHELYHLNHELYHLNIKQSMV